MAETQNTWQHAVKENLKPLRDRVVRGLGGVMPEPAPRGLSYDELVTLLYPTLPDELRPVVDEAAAGPLTRASTIRRMLGTIEHQVAPTAFSVQLSEEDTVPCTVGGVDLLCDAADAAVTPGLLSGEYEVHLSAVFEKYCTTGMTVIDVGANIGYYSLLASRLVGPSGRVIALEPNSENCRLLLSSLRLNDITNVQLLPVAADTSTGWAYYSTHVGSNGGLIEGGELLSRPGTVVPTFRLDELVDGRVDLLKMDVEGAEGRVVRGATRIIERDRPIVTSELKDEMLRRVSDGTVAEYLGYFEKLGYSVSLLEKASATEKPYASVADLLADWGETDELRDVLLLPRPV
ncbi:MAG TPA: FkbM family methyltransferase [Acidimicrobiales bacterium]|jgi:FkbM family methyltransferase|nr:FkbM family methyltransferase [Acidimicrobiales bacterium]